MELCKVNFMNLNKQFMSSCVNILKEDNSSCLAPAVFDYISHTMNIISKVQITSGLPQMQRLLREIKKRKKLLSSKYRDVKAKQRKICGKKSRRKSPKLVEYTGLVAPNKNSLLQQKSNHPSLPRPSQLPPQQNCSKPKPAVGGHFLTQHIVTQPIVTQSIVTQPIVTQSIVTQPIVTQSIVTQPIVAEPVPQMPEPTAPQAFPFSPMPIIPIKLTENLPMPFRLPIPAHKPIPNLTSLPPATPKLSWFTNPFPTLTPPVPNGFQVPPASAQPSTQDDDDDDKPYEPPVAVFTPVVEEHALYSKRCKLFEKREAKFVDRGVGMLYVNQMETDKYQLVIRADNALGTPLLNLRLTSSLPFQKSGVNNVMTVDPSADKGKGASMLIKVKTADDANELFEKISYYKKLSIS